ncbi:hypothetical protein SAMN02927914_06008 [Mesorhizobium qingshengii]|uniref:Uncharacterized protein n=2 Tax=Mesorhizobium qingshengii TaxID=1165689 RepID=A0A1G5ZTI8_9HYPH|nr:hypothetical protein SAMN02927914_06008 [Mesorhizobium qingshengii]
MHRENIKYLEEKLETEMGPAARAMLQKQIDEEKAKLRKITNCPPTEWLN